MTQGRFFMFIRIDHSFQPLRNIGTAHGAEPQIAAAAADQARGEAEAARFAATDVAQHQNLAATTSV
jgi:hypothetical protein